MNRTGRQANILIWRPAEAIWVDSILIVQGAKEANAVKPQTLLAANKWN